MRIAEVRGLTKRYPAFTLDGVSFSLDAGRIAGFIGRNGAGKTTTIKSMLNLVHPDSGSVSCFGAEFTGREEELKRRIGYSTGAANYYPRKKIRLLVDVTRGFFPNWDEAAYEEYRGLFGIDEEKTPRELSEGMRVKLNLLLALSHRAELLILDEPTSGLDPFSRDELLTVFTELRARGVAVLFSTHITSDLERCSDDIIYIRKGKIAAACPKDEFISKHSRPGETLEQTVLRMEREAGDA